MVVIYGLGNMPGNRRAVPSASGIDVSRPLHVRRDLRGSQLLAGKPPTTTALALAVRICALPQVANDGMSAIKNGARPGRLW